MNVLVSLSPTPMAHPPRSNPPLRFSSSPPGPCATPSTVTCVVVGQFHDCGCLLGGAPSGRPLTPATNTATPIRHRLPDFFRGLSGTPVVSDPTATVSERLHRILRLGNHVDRDARMGPLPARARWPTPFMVHTNRGQPQGLTINPVNSREFAKDVRSDLRRLIANVRISAI